MNKTVSSLTIGGLAKAAGVGVETIRFYQRRDLLAEPDRPLGGIRRYSRVDVARIIFIKSSQRLGFSLNEVAGLLKLSDGSQCDEARVLAEHKLTDVQNRIADLRRIELALQELISCCKTSQSEVQCPLISALQEKTADEDIF
ncbi:MerR family mercuric resistance operon transcriptional regulator [Methylobacter tundripaludum]|uniref:Mercuric resistance operon regulatory protein n=1 Tax=Methylobacter tundripaludum TaxID=173365 RepID=A0A2S6HF03_9GAMM|nr:Hg(II)-responsive transcriptional regulator [Methylobacter tundripaludum]PPK76020.1 MerR family mercuric resistance operon transcriptional regulator [Methylobacter tundripaludum]